MAEPQEIAPSVLTLAPAEPGERPAGPPEGGAEVHYHLPVEIEVRAAPAPTDPDTLAQQALLGLARGLANT